MTKVTNSPPHLSISEDGRTWGLSTWLRCLPMRTARGYATVGTVAALHQCAARSRAALRLKWVAIIMHHETKPSFQGDYFDFCTPVVMLSIFLRVF
jgi:hypothetical protein